MKFDVIGAENKLIDLKNELVKLNIELEKADEDVRSHLENKADELKDIIINNLNHNNILNDIVVYCLDRNIYISTLTYTGTYFLKIYKNLYDDVLIETNINYNIANNELFTISGLLIDKFKNKKYDKIILKIFSENTKIDNEHYAIVRKIQILENDISNLTKSIESYEFFKNVKVGFSFDLKEEELLYPYKKHKLDRYIITNSLNKKELNISILDIDEDYIVYCFNNNQKNRKKKTNIYKMLKNDFIINKNSLRKTKLKLL